eukprot:353401-Chlamydomonas_euryale.AAC.3
MPFGGTLDAGEDPAIIGNQNLDIKYDLLAYDPAGGGLTRATSFNNSLHSAHVRKIQVTKTLPGRCVGSGRLELDS